MRICSIEGCGKLHRAKGLCTLHWKRHAKYGDPHKVGKSPDFAQSFLRDVVLGYDGDECLIWPYHRDNKGYGRIRANQRSMVVSRLVCIDANGDPPAADHQAAHTCGNGHIGCVAKRHLEWKTAAENTDDKIRHGRTGNKLTPEIVLAIRKSRQSMTIPATAAMYGCSLTTVKQITSRATWGWVN